MLLRLSTELSRLRKLFSWQMTVRRSVFVVQVGRATHVIWNECQSRWFSAVNAVNNEVYFVRTWTDC